MSSLLDFIGGVADHSIKQAERKREQEDLDAQMERQYKLTTRLEEFRDKLEQERNKRTAKSSRVNGDVVEILNGNDEVISTRPATELERVNYQAALRAPEDERKKTEAELAYKSSAADAQRANAIQSRASAGLLGEQQRILRETGSLPGRGGSGSESFPYRVGSDEAAARGAIDQFANTLDFSDPEMIKIGQELDAQLTKIEAIQDPQARALELKRLAASLPKE